MRLRVVVVGIAGVGKTTVLEKLRSRVKGAKLVTFGSVMLEEATRRKWVKHRDELRKLPVEKQRRLQTLAAGKIAEMRDKVIMVDTHLFIRTNEGFWPGLPFEVARALKPTHLVLVEASPEEVLRRRAADPSRRRDAVKHGDLESEMALARQFLAVSSTLTGAPMLMIMNEEGGADQAAAALARILEEASA